MGPSKDAFAVCGAIFFAALGAMLMATGSVYVQQMAAVALLTGAVSQWLAQDSKPGMWLFSRIAAYTGMGIVYLALIGYLIR